MKFLLCACVLVLSCVCLVGEDRRISEGEANEFLGGLLSGKNHNVVGMFKMGSRTIWVLQGARLSEVTVCVSKGEEWADMRLAGIDIRNPANGAEVPFADVGAVTALSYTYKKTLKDSDSTVIRNYGYVLGLGQIYDIRTYGLDLELMGLLRIRLDPAGDGWK